MLDSKAARIINSTENIVTGTGPDAIINSDKSRIKSSNLDYLSKLLEMIDSRKILFSSDFPCNAKRVENFFGPNLDWNSKIRIIERGLTSGLSKKDIEGILSKNAIRFFKL